MSIRTIHTVLSTLFAFLSFTISLAADNGFKANSPLAALSDTENHAITEIPAPSLQEVEELVAIPENTEIASQAHNDKKQFSFYFRHDEYELDQNYRNNAELTQTLLDFLKSGIQIDSIGIVSSASPEGVYEHNVKLSKLRAATLKELITSNIQMDETRIHLYPKGEDWEGFKAFIEYYYYKPDRNKVLNILNAKIGNDTKKWRLKQLNGGKTYSDIIYNYAYRFRTANSIIVYGHTPSLREVEELAAIQENTEIASQARNDEKVARNDKEVGHNGKEQARNDENDITIANEEPSLREVEELAAIQEDTETIEIATPEARNDKEVGHNGKEQARNDKEVGHNGKEQARNGKETVIAIKTNLLFDLGTFLNYAVEVPIGERISIQAQSINPWFRTKNNQYTNETITLGGDFRIWLGDRTNKDRLIGHHIGLYGFSGKADLQWKKAICYQTHFVSAGLSYGFALPIGKALNLEFCIAAGWARLDYQHYMPSEDYSILYKDYNDFGSMNYFGPTKVEISLVLPIRAKVGGRK